MATNLKLGSVNIANMYLGNIAISKAYLGNTLIYSKASEPEPTVTAGLLGDLSKGYSFYKDNESEADPTLVLTGNSIKITPISNSMVGVYYHVKGLNASTRYTLTWNDTATSTWVEVYGLDQNGNVLDEALASGMSGSPGQTVTRNFSGYTGYEVVFFSVDSTVKSYNDINMSQ